MSISDFLFEGNPPPSVTTYGQTVETMPKWLSDYTQGLISKSNAIASEPYQAYGGPRIAPRTDDQNAGADYARGNIGSAMPYFGEGRDALRQGTELAGDAATGRFIDPGVSDSYMNPYTKHVLDRQAELSSRNLNENFLPALKDAFTSSGQFGSSRMLEMGQRGTRDIAEGLQSQQLAALSGGYDRAGDLYNQDQTRNLQGSTNLQNAGRNFVDMGMNRQDSAIKDAGVYETIGGLEQDQNQASADLAYQDFERQRDYPRQNLDWMANIVNGIPHDRTLNTSDSGPLGNSYQPSGASQLLSLITGGLGIYDTFKSRQDPNSADPSSTPSPNIPTDFPSGGYNTGIMAPGTVPGTGPYTGGPPPVTNDPFIGTVREGTPEHLSFQKANPGVGALPPQTFDPNYVDDGIRYNAGGGMYTDPNHPFYSPPGGNTIQLNRGGRIVPPLSRGYS